MGWDDGEGDPVIRRARLWRHAVGNALVRMQAADAIAAADETVRAFDARYGEALEKLYEDRLARRRQASDALGRPLVALLDDDEG